MFLMLNDLTLISFSSWNGKTLIKFYVFNTWMTLAFNSPTKFISTSLSLFPSFNSLASKSHRDNIYAVIYSYQNSLTTTFLQDFLAIMKRMHASELLENLEDMFTRYYMHRIFFSILNYTLACNPLYIVCLFPFSVCLDWW